MKKLIVVAIFVASLAIGSPVFAQNEKSEKKIENESEYYYVNVSLEKIFPYRKGYVVQYRKGFTQYARAYLPSKWFTDAGSKAEIITLPQGKAWPSMSVYYKDGEFSHVRLYVHHVPTHQSWGSIPQNINLDDKFDHLDSVKIEY